MERGLEGGHVATVVELSLDERATLTGGADAWHTTGVPRLGVPPMRFTDGPSGARGIRFTGEVSTSLPCGTALAATWNMDLVRQVGELLGIEAQSKGAHVLLAPTVNVHRHPLAGRNFECFSEDPYLSAQLADAYIRGVQSCGVGCTIKHLVANDQEHDRLEISVDVDERALREIYLPAFETAVRRSGVWAVMAAYNRLHGIHCSEHAWLLNDLLRREWGFDGVVMSDWFGTHSTLAVAAGLDLEMPGPPRFLGPHVAAAVHQGEVLTQTLDKSADNILRLSSRVTTEAPLEPRLDQPRQPEPAVTARYAATEAIVLLTNDGLLPLTPPDSPPARGGIAVLGPKADRPDIQGGGSAHVDPPYVVSPLEGISNRAESAGLSVRHEVGVPVRPPAALEHELSLPDGGAGLLVEYFDGFHPAGVPEPGHPVASETVPRTRLFWTGSPASGLSAEAGATIRSSASFVPERSGDWHLSLTSVGPSRVWLDGDVIIDNMEPVPGTSFFGQGSAEVTADRPLVAGQAYRLVVELYVPGWAPPEHERPVRWRMSGVELTAQPPADNGALDVAVNAAESAETVVVVVGEDVTSTEGVDRTTLDLPPDQVELVRAVAAVNPATVVVVNTGAPVTMPWADDVAAVVQLWYLGQETGNALAVVLFGDEDATGRLPTTFPRRLDDTPAHGMFPGANGRVRYGEGVMVGYRHCDTDGVDPQFCFGHGLSYTQFTYSEPQVTARDGVGQLEDRVLVDVEVVVTNVGSRRGTEVVQLYVHDVEASVRRPDQELKAFTKVALAPGENRMVHLELPWRSFAFWDVHSHGWVVEPGRFEIRVGSSSRAIHHVAPIDL